jgi:uncharacterized GH25 family protein
MVPSIEDESEKKVKILEDMQTLIKAATSTVHQIIKIDIGYLWFEKKIEEPFIKALIELSFECLENQTKGYKDVELKETIFGIIQ